MADISGGAMGPDYSGILGEIKNSISTYLTNETLFFREAVLRMMLNKEYTDDDKNYRKTLKGCIDRAKILTDEVFSIKLKDKDKNKT